MTIDEYIDAAKAAQKIKSDRELGRVLGFEGTPVCHWRTKRGWPADDTMVRLATMAGLDVNIALLELNLWRSKSFEVSSAYSTILQKISNRTAAIIICFFICAGLNISPINLENMGNKVTQGHF